jgi:hypothetical protein
MKTNWEDDYEMPAEYDLSKLKRVPNPFTQRFRELNLVSLDADVKAAFPDSESVNQALRKVMNEGKAAEQSVEYSKAS